MSKSFAPVAPPPSAGPLKTAIAGKISFFGPDSDGWRDLKADIPAGTDQEREKQLIAAAKAAKDELKTFLLSSLQMQHVVVLAGSGRLLVLSLRGRQWRICGNFA